VNQWGQVPQASSIACQQRIAAYDTLLAMGTLARKGPKLQTVSVGLLSKIVEAK